MATYNFMAVSPCSIFMQGERRSFKAGDVFPVEDEPTANQLQDNKHPQYAHLRLLSVEGLDDEPKTESSRGEQILSMLNAQTAPENFKAEVVDVVVDSNAVLTSGTSLGAGLEEHVQVDSEVNSEADTLIESEIEPEPEPEVTHPKKRRKTVEE